MDYREFPPPAGLEQWIKCRWSLDCGGTRDAQVEHRATPDGCLELIHRYQGHSLWDGDQPDMFVAGLITGPATLRFSGDARFSAIRIWPWAWNALGLGPGRDIIDRWRPLPVPSLDDLSRRIDAARSPAMEAMAASILASGSVGALSAATGRPHRWLQRWFATHVGLPPRSYLRLLRFQDAFTGLQRGDDPLAAHAADHGYADQAHMARDFRSFADRPASRARRSAKGPFL